MLSYDRKVGRRSSRSLIRELFLVSSPFFCLESNLTALKIEPGKLLDRTGIGKMADQTKTKLITHIRALLEPIGFEPISVEFMNQTPKKLRVFIDHLNNPHPEKSKITIDDCVKATHALNEPLDQVEEADLIFKGSYELEVSSPGVNRPLAQSKDFEVFAGHRVKIHTFRSLKEEEIDNKNYLTKNPKQKNFIGTLLPSDENVVRLLINEKDQIQIPFGLISKANLEPDLDVLLSERKN